MVPLRLTTAHEAPSGSPRAARGAQGAGSQAAGGSAPGCKRSVTATHHHRGDTWLPGRALAMPAPTMMCQKKSQSQLREERTRRTTAVGWSCSSAIITRGKGKGENPAALVSHYHLYFRIQIKSPGLVAQAQHQNHNSAIPSLSCLQPLSDFPRD